MKILGYIEVVISIVLGVILIISANIVAGIITLVIGPINGMVLVYASNVQRINDNVNYAINNSKANSKRIKELQENLEKSIKEISTLKKELEELKK